MALALVPLLGPAEPTVVHAAGPTCTASGTTTTCTFDYTGAAQSWAVPGGVSQATFDLYGAAGADTGGSALAGGKGAHVQATVAVTACQVLGVYIGGQAIFQNGSGVSTHTTSSASRCSS